MGRMMAIGTEWQYLEAAILLAEVVRRVNAVTRKDIERVLERFPLTTWAEFRLLPEE